MKYGLPKSVEIGGEEFRIRYDYRVILEILEVLNDTEITDEERAYAALLMFYVDYDGLTDYDTAVKKCLEFISCGKSDSGTQKKAPNLVEWERDFPYIAGPVNRVLGYEIRDVPYDEVNSTGGVHWWTFVGAYSEIGDCFFAQVVRIRELRAKGRPLDKQDREFYRRNRDVIDLKAKLTDAESDIVNAWIRK